MAVNKKQKLESLAIRATQWVGTFKSIILHTIVFTGVFLLPFFGIPLDAMLLVLTTVVSLEAIYLAIFIQMIVNRSMESLEGVEEDIDEIHEDVKGLESDVEEISKDVEDISEDVEEITQDMDKIQEKNVENTIADTNTRMTLEKIEQGLQKLLGDIDTLKRGQ